MEDKLRTKLHTEVMITTHTDKYRFRPSGRRIQSEGKEERTRWRLKGVGGNK